MAMSRKPTLFIIALLVATPWYSLSVAATPSPSSTAPIKPLLLTEGLLDRMIAVARESKTIDALQPRDDDENHDDSDEVPSIASMGDQMDANPVARAMLARHGFTGQSYLLAMTTLARAGAQARMAGTQWASKMPDAAMVDPRNVAFYKTNTAKIHVLTALNNPDYSPEEDAQMTRELRSIDPADFGDCVLLVPTILSLTPHVVPGSSAVDPSSRIELARSTSPLATHFHSERLKKDFTVIAAEVRRHAHEPKLESAGFETSLGDARDWASSHCKGNGK
ncbi:hypothetical protein PY254_13715 [Rhodanobacter sp. AS-Z3]|uniref:hypothetical protein n=1 Tax=Rhodanobacter sp. AS-Z3 TaxID=3031330 RepID=UPI002479C42E|nr:hypothetical protein [Rhodanobacter sp. AS-Z3]WEN14288.1 hypothetical protein PY254_13715 [Rhodanobacter sp. AS-Z3]